MPLLKLQLACPAFRNNLVLFLFHSDGTALFIFILFGFLIFLSVFESTFCLSFNVERNFDIFN